MWKYQGFDRPPFAQEPSAGQESVWDYPRPPILQKSPARIEVKHEEMLIGSSQHAIRIIETASPPTYYLPPEDIDWSCLVEVSGNSFCEWKGMASYWAMEKYPQFPVAWSYNRPKPAFFEVRGFVSFYPGRVACFLDGERVRPQPGEFYGGWVTDAIVGPFKGEEGSEHW